MPFVAEPLGLSSKLLFHDALQHQESLPALGMMNPAHPSRHDSIEK